MNKIMLIFLMLVFLVACAPQPENYNDVTNSSSSNSSMTIEIISAGTYYRAWKLYDRETETLCYGNIEGGINCKFLDK